jgi:hypothetical protein
MSEIWICFALMNIPLELGYMSDYQKKGLAKSLFSCLVMAILGPLGTGAILYLFWRRLMRL